MLKAILIDLIPHDMSRENSTNRLTEAENLILTYGGIVLLKSIQKKTTPCYKTYIGTGKLEQLKEEGLKLGANILIVNNELKSLQTYNLSEILRHSHIQVWDRIDLILKIFQKHAVTKEARLEIELASLKHMGPRIYGMGMILSRQAGGIGGRGIGETNTEIMRRHISEHIHKIESDLKKCQNTRQLHRLSRIRKNLKSVGIIGYTNAGKSSLMNALTGKNVYVADELFATLDTRVGKLHFNLEKNTLLIDTIGFIQDLPHFLIKSFQSTLEETVHSDLLIHIIDLTDPQFLKKIAVVNEVLANIKANAKPTILVFNKIDLLDSTFNFRKIKKSFSRFNPIFVSSIKKTGLIELKKLIYEKLFKTPVDKK